MKSTSKIIRITLLTCSTLVIFNCATQKNALLLDQRFFELHLKDLILMPIVFSKPLNIDNNRDSLKAAQVSKKLTPKIVQQIISTSTKSLEKKKYSVLISGLYSSLDAPVSFDDLGLDSDNDPTKLAKLSDKDYMIFIFVRDFAIVDLTFQSQKNRSIIVTMEAKFISKKEPFILWHDRSKIAVGDPIPWDSPAIVDLEGPRWVSLLDATLREIDNQTKKLLESLPAYKSK